MEVAYEDKVAFTFELDAVAPPSTLSGSSVGLSALGGGGNCAIAISFRHSPISSQHVRSRRVNYAWRSGSLRIMAVVSLRSHCCDGCSIASSTHSHPLLFSIIATGFRLVGNLPGFCRIRRCRDHTAVSSSTSSTIDKYFFKNYLLFFGNSILFSDVLCKRTRTSAVFPFSLLVKRLSYTIQENCLFEHLVVLRFNCIFTANLGKHIDI